MEMEEAEWIAVRSYGRCEALEVSKRSPKRVVARDGNRDRHVLIADIMASGAEEAIKLLAQRINSSRALSAEEAHQSSLRHQARVAKLIADFVPTPPTEE